MPQLRPQASPAQQRSIIIWNSRFIRKPKEFQLVFMIYSVFDLILLLFRSY
jgi:hypothetical protein